MKGLTLQKHGLRISMTQDNSRVYEREDLAEAGGLEPDQMTHCREPLQVKLSGGKGTAWHTTAPKATTTSECVRSDGGAEWNTHSRTGGAAHAQRSWQDGFIIIYFLLWERIQDCMVHMEEPGNEWCGVYDVKFPKNH